MTTGPITTSGQRELIHQLTRLVAECSQGEVEIRRRRTQEDAASKAEYQSRREQVIAQFESDYLKLQAEFREAREAVQSKFESEGSALAQEEQTFTEQAAKEHAVALENAKQDWQIARQRLLASLDAKQQVPGKELAQFEQQWDRCARQLGALEQKAQRILRRRGCRAAPAAEPAAPARDHWKGQYLEGCVSALHAARRALRRLRRRWAARFNEMGGPLLLFALVSLAAAYPAWWLLAPSGYGWIAAAAAVGLIVAAAARQALRLLGRRQTLAVLPAFQAAVAAARAALEEARQTAKQDAERKHKALADQREDQVNAAHARWARTRNKIQSDYEARIKRAAEKFQARRDVMTRTHARQTEALNQKYPPLIRQLERGFEAELLKLSESYRTQLANSRQQFQQRWHSLVTRWASGIAGFQTAVDRVNYLCNARFPKWDEIAWQAWRPPADGLTVLPFGQYALDLHALPHGLPQGEELQVAQTQFCLPAVLSYPECPSLLLQATGEGRQVAVQTLQNVMLRLLTSLPPGKVRFTIVDPVGLGQNFSVFMHLADYDERLVTSRIWTESAHINQRLADLTEHMENVIQKYLRNEFASIQQYNQQAGEVAEPFQILVVANFPAGFAEEATRRLVSIASSGARCGVYTLISTDMKMKLPRNFDLADLEAHAATLVWHDGRFCWKDEDLRDLPLTLHGPPGDDHFTAAVRAVGQLAKDSSRVEVPFATVVPEPGRWWSSDSRGELEVPLGRAGATQLQYMRLGKGTSQHVLISGKTGSGKSTLLHALITNLSIHYSPDEVQFYLVDFKKGVEFKAYATYQLPHARVIAIESEREFGMSVLERLDVELRRRGDLFRAAGVQDIHAYRDANPDAVLPRVLLIIDEFQELFVSDDKIAQDASLLLDRLVRQGRAFGIHVLLGSQTLAGAYSLARSTIGQMAVRIALQCSETDAHLILSEDNTAARLLNRPGEAIYNDANGLFEGNHPFQVVWLPDDQRESFLRKIARLAGARHTAAPAPIVFEGNVPADPSENRLLRKALEAPGPAGPATAPRAWLGAAVAIKDPTSVVFRRQSGSNLLMVGHQEEMALGVLSNCLISLAAQCTAACPARQGGGRQSAPGRRLRPFYLLDGTRPESSEADFWKRLAGALPLDLQIAAPRDSAGALAAIAQEVDRRLKANELTAEPIFLVVYHLSRFRDLKKSDDFSFSSLDEEGPPPANQQFATILREGPAVGVHALLWCDSYNNANRWLDRQTLHDLEMRVLFQMSATDSSNLIDSPAASRLGVHRAILYRQEHGQAEKFRPYGLPSSQWLAWVKEQLDRRSIKAPTA